MSETDHNLSLFSNDSGSGMSVSAADYSDWSNLSKYACISLDGKKCWLAKKSQNEVWWYPIEDIDENPKIVFNETVGGITTHKYSDGSQKWFK